MCIASCKINYFGSKWGSVNVNATSGVYGCEISFNYLSFFDLEIEGLNDNIKLTFSACPKKKTQKNLMMYFECSFN